MGNGRNDRKSYCVVRFIEVPFERVDNHVCVPDCWIIVRQSNDKVVVTYPNEEDPFDTRDRAKKRERPCKEWKLYMAEVKYETDKYRHAEYWIASRNDFGPIVKADSKQEGTPKVMKKLQARTTESGTATAAVASGSRSASSQVSYVKRAKSSKARQAEKRQPSLPVIETNESIDVSVDRNDQSQERQTASSSQSAHASAAMTAPMTSLLPMSAGQLSHSDHHQIHSQNSEAPQPEFKPIITEVRSIPESNSEQTRADGTPNNESYASHHLPGSLKMSAELYRQMNDRPSLISVHKPIEKRIRLANSERLVAIAKASSNFEERMRSPPRSQEQSSTQSSSQDIPRFQIKIGKSCHPNALDPKAIIQRIDDFATASGLTSSVPQQLPSFDRKVTRPRSSPPPEQSQQQPTSADALQGCGSRQPISGLEINIPACPVIPTSIANQTVVSSSTQHRSQPQQYFLNVQHQLRLSEPHVGVPTDVIDDRRLPAVSGVSKRALHVQPSVPDSIKHQNTNTYNDYHQQRLDARLEPKLPQDLDSRVAALDIASAAAGETHRPETPSCSSNEYRREPPGSDNQPHSSQQQPMHQFPNMAMQPGTSGCNFANPSAAPSRPRSADHLHQAEKHIDVDLVSSDNSSDPETVDHRGISQQETLTSNPGTSQSSTSATTQLNSKMAPELLDFILTLLTQVGYTLYNWCELFENFQNVRSSILETAESYKKLLDIAESFSSIVTAKGAASFNSLVSYIEEREKAKAAKRAHPSSQCLQSRNDSEPPSKKSALLKVVLPAEYDPDDTGWTLKYRKMVPELRELLAGRGIYVNSPKLMHAERISKNCKTLATLVIEEVYSEAALIVCSTWTEVKNPKTCVIKRPPLDPRAWDALFNYVIRFGSLHKWKIDPREIVEAMDHKIYETRSRHDLLTEPYSS